MFFIMDKINCSLADGEVIAIDGKNLKHSYDKKAGNRAINMVSAWLQFS